MEKIIEIDHTSGINVLTQEKRNKMKAPDKIYILHHEDYSDRRILNAFIEKEEDTDIEYIRKDALLEWAKEMKEIMFLGGHISIDDIISKIESL